MQARWANGECCLTRLLQDQCSSGDLTLAVAGSGGEGSVSRSGTLLGGAVGKALAAVKDGWLDLPPQQVVASKWHHLVPQVQFKSARASAETAQSSILAPCKRLGAVVIQPPAITFGRWYVAAAIIALKTGGNS